MTTNISDDPEYWRKQAEEARSLAEQIADAYTKSIMLGVARSYDKIARWVEDRSRKPR